MGADDKGEALAVADRRAHRGFGDEQKVVAVGRGCTVGGNPHEARRAEAALPAGHVVEARERHAGDRFLEPVRREAEDQIAEQRRTGLDRHEQSARGERGGELSRQSLVGTVQDVARQNEVEGGGRQSVDVLDHLHRARQSEAGAFGQTPVGVQHGEPGIRLAGECGGAGRERAESDLKDAQRPVRRHAAAGFGHDPRDHVGGGAGRGAAQMEGVQSRRGQAGGGRRVARHDPPDQGGGVGEQHQFGGQFRMVGRDPAHGLFRRGKGHVAAQAPDTLLEGRETAALQGVEGVGRPRMQGSGQAAIEGHLALLGEAVGEAVGERRRPAFQQQVARSEIGRVRCGRGGEARAQPFGHARAPLQRQGRRLGGALDPLRDGVGVEIAAAAGAQGLEPALADRRDDLALGIGQGEVGQDRALVAAPGADLGAGDRGTGAQQAHLAEAHRHVGLGGALAHQLGEEQDQAVEAGIEARGHEAVAVVGLGRDQLGDDGGLVDARRGRDLPEVLAEAEAGGERPAVEPVTRNRVLGRDREVAAGRHGEVALDDLGRGVELPRRRGQAGAAEDLDLVAGARQAHQHLAQALLGEDHRREDLDVGERHALRAERLTGDVQRHLDEGGTGQDHLTVDAVVVEFGHECRVEMAVPFEAVGREARADERVVGPRRGAGPLGGLGEAERAALPGIERQGDDSGRIGTEQARLIDGGTRDEGGGDRLGDRIAADRLAVHHADRGHLDGERLDGVADMRQQGRARADLDEDAGALAGRLLQRLAEAHGLADVAPPVAGAELGAGEHRAGYGRDHGGVTGRRLEPVEVAQQRTLGRIHQAAVEGVFEIELAPAAALARQRLHRGLDIGLGAGHRDRLGAVIGSDVEGGIVGEERLHLLGRSEQHGHGAEAARRFLVLAAVEDHPHRLFQAQDAGGLGRGDLADAVAEHVAGREALGAQGRGRGALDREDQRLRDAGQRETRVEILGEHRFLERPAGELLEQLVGLIEAGAEGLALLIGLAAHADPLAAVAGIDEGDLRLAFDRRADDGSIALLALRQRPQGGGNVGLGGERQGESRAEALAAVERGGRDAGGFGRRGAVEASSVVEGEIVQGGAALGGEQQDLGRGARIVSGRDRACVGQHDVGVGATETERVHASEALGFGTDERQRRAVDRELHRLERDVGVQFGRVQRGRQQVVLEREAGLQEAREPRSRLGMADIGLDRADRQRGLAGLAELAPDGPGLDRIADGGAGPVRLDEGEFVEVDLGVAVDLLQQRALRVARGQRDAGGAPVRVDAARRDHAAHGPAAAGGRLGRLQDQDDAALSAHVAVGAGREGLAQAGAREHLRIGEGDEVERARQDVGAGHHGGVDLPRFNRRDRRVERDQRRRAGRVEGEARTLQVVDVGDAVRDDRERVAGGRVGVARGRVENAQVAVIERRGADEHADMAAGDRGGAQARILERFPGQFQQHALLRVHLLGLARRDAEHARIERPDVVEHAGGPGVALAPLLRARMPEGLQRPAILGDA